MPSSQYVGQPGKDFGVLPEIHNQFLFNHLFNDQWSLFAGASSLFFTDNNSQTYAFQQLGPATSTEFLRTQQAYQDSEQAQSGMINLTGEIDTWRVKHKLLVGTEQVYYNSVSNTSLQLSAVPFNVAKPVYSPDPAFAIPLFDLNSPAFRQVRHGYYVQDLITINKHWQLLGGVRIDDTPFVYDRTNIELGVSQGDVYTNQIFHYASPRGGIVYQPLPDVMSIYFNYNKAFNAPTGQLSYTQTLVKPEIGEQYELGIKTVLLPGLTFNVAAFRILRQNVPYSNLTAAGPVFFQAQNQGSQGVEMNLVGKLTEAWSVIGNYTYTGTKVTDPNEPLLAGGPPQANVPLNSGNLWTRYNFIHEKNRTAGAALGMVALGRRSADNQASVYMPEFCRWDTAFYYTQGNLNATLLFQNIFNTYYDTGSIASSNGLQIQPAAPFTVRGQITYKF